MPVNTIPAAMRQLDQLRPFLPAMQFKLLRVMLKAEEAGHFAEKIAEYHDRIATMPKTYDQDGKGDKAVVHLHYFHGGSDWYITEKDMSGNGTEQAFGYVVLNGDMMNAELGYISINELAENGVELDLYWTPATLGEVKATRHGAEHA